jgi:hypothetical protein
MAVGRIELTGDSAERDLLGQHLDGVQRGGLARAVQGLARDRRDGGRGPDVDDPSVVRDRAGGRLQGEEGAVGVDGEQMVELGVGDVEERDPIFSTPALAITMSMAEKRACASENSRSMSIRLDMSARTVIASTPNVAIWAAVASATAGSLTKLMTTFAPRLA